MKADIIVIGGGLVGLTSALALADAGFSVALLEGRAKAESDLSKIDLRVSAITHRTQALFERLGVWEAMRQMRVAPYHHMTVWDGTGDGRIEFDGAEMAQETLGHIIENSVMSQALLQKLEAHERCQLFYDTKPQAISERDEGMLLTAEDGREFAARLVAGADGRNSWLRAQMGITPSKKDYKQKGVVAVIETQKPHQHTAWQRFLPTGPLAFLPLFEANLCSIVWSVPAERADKLVAMPEVDFNTALAEAFESQLGTAQVKSTRAAFPLQRQICHRYAQAGRALIGDAIHVIHPLAGQGVNLGLQDVAALVEVLAEAKARGRDWWALPTLKRFERARKGENYVTTFLMEGFNHFFSNETPVLSFLRNKGLSLCDKSTRLKQAFVRFSNH